MAHTTSSSRSESELSVIAKDVRLLNQLGYKQEFKRYFSPWEVFGVGFSIIGILPSVASVLVYALPNGGAVALVWGWLVGCVFLTLVTLSLAELGSAMPTIGGLYFWTHRYAAPRYRNFLSWMVGYSNTIGQISGIASVNWACAVQITAAVSIGRDGNYIATVGQTYGIMIAIMVAQAVITIFFAGAIAKLQTAYIIANVVLSLAVIIALPAGTPSEFRNDAAYAFGDFTNLYGWNDGFAFMLSLLAPLWCIGAFDASTHMSEEASNASIAVPYALIWSAGLSSIIGFAINIALAFTMGNDMGAILESAYGQPFATILVNSLGKPGALAIWSWIIIVQFTIGTSIMTTSSRQIFAFARDGALPFSKYLYVHRGDLGTPWTCIIFGCVIGAILNCLAFAGPAAIGAVFSIVIIGQFFAYGTPVICRFVGGQEFTPGPFSLGAFGAPVALVSVLFMLFISIVFLFPAAPTGLTAQNMNYTVVVFGAVLIFAAIYYFFPVYGGRHWFEGPVNTYRADGSYIPDEREKKVQQHQRAQMEEKQRESKDGSEVDEKVSESPSDTMPASTLV